MEENFFALKVSFEETSARLTKLTQRFLFASAATKPEPPSAVKQESLPKTSKAPLESIKPKILSKAIRTGIHSMYLSFGSQANAGIYLPIKLPNLYVVTNRRNEPLLLTSRHAFPDEKPRRVLFVFSEKPDLVDFFYKAFHVINRGNITKAKYPLRCEKIPLSDFGSWLTKNAGQYQIVFAGPVIKLPEYQFLIIDSVKTICPKADIFFDFKKEDPIFFNQNNLGGPKICISPEDDGLDPYFFDNLDFTPPFSKKVLNDLDSGRFYRRLIGIQKALEVAEKNNDNAAASISKDELSRYQNILVKKLVFDVNKLKNSKLPLSDISINPRIPDFIGFYIFINGNLSKVDPVFARLEDLIDYMHRSPKRFNKDTDLTIKVDRLPGKKIELLIKKNLMVL